jgi:hypothetical protein
LKLEKYYAQSNGTGNARLKEHKEHNEVRLSPGVDSVPLKGLCRAKIRNYCNYTGMSKNL